MPELPEVEVIIRELEPKLVGQTVSDIQAIWHKTIVKYDYSPENQKIVKLSRHGKYIIIHLTDGAIIVHLRMTGQIILKDVLDKNARHLRAYISFESGKIFHFFDSRKFGRIYLTTDPEAVLKNTGIDALDENFTVNTLMQILAGKKRQIKSVLLDQKYVAGLGNIYIDESLFLAGIHPLMPASHLKESQITSLHNAILYILSAAINGMGTTISDYRTVGGGFGEFQNSLKVYGRNDFPCTACGTPIQKIRVNNRGTHFCPKCQASEN